MSVMEDQGVLVQRAVDGDREAFSELAARHWRRLVALARSVTAALDSEDVVQDALIKAWLKLDSLREPAAFSAWLTRIVVTTAIEAARRLRPEVPIDEAILPAAESGSADSRIDVARLLGLLAPRQRAVLHLTVSEGMTDEEIGAAIGIAASSVRVHRLRARRRLAELVQGG